MAKINKIIVVILIMSLFMSSIAYAVPVFTLEDALYYGKIKSFYKGDIKSQEMKIKEKKKAIPGAKGGATLSLSLDFMKIFEDDPPYQKVFGNVTKVPKAYFDYNMSVDKLPYSESKVEQEIKTAYLSVYKAKLEMERKKLIYYSEEEKLKLGEKKLEKGEIDKEILNEQKKTRDTSKKSYDKSVDNYKNKIQKLKEKVYLKNRLPYDSSFTKYIQGLSKSESEISKLVNSKRIIKFEDISEEYNFDMQLKRARVGNNELPKLIDKAIKNSWEVHTLEENSKIEAYYIYASLQLYKGEFGSSKMKELQTLINSGLNSIDDLDLAIKYEKLIDNLISKYGEKWTPYFKIKLLFFSIKVPKLFKFKEYAGVRFLEDARYDLQLRIMKFQQLLADKEKQEKMIAEIVSSLFLDINNLDLEYETLQNEMDTLSKEYEINQTKYKNGLIKPEMLIDQKKELDDKKEKIQSVLFDMNDKILELDYMTKGHYLKLTVNSDASIPQNTSSPFRVPSIDELMEDVKKMNEESYTIEWKIESVAKEDAHISTVDFGLNIKGSGFDATNYQVFTTDGIQLSEKLDISQNYRHFAFVFEDKKNIKLKFYKNNEQIYEGKLDGYGENGSIIIVND